MQVTTTQYSFFKILISVCVTMTTFHYQIQWHDTVSVSNTTHPIVKSKLIRAYTGTCL